MRLVFVFTTSQNKLLISAPLLTISLCPLHPREDPNKLYQKFMPDAGNQFKVD